MTNNWFELVRCVMKGNIALSASASKEHPSASPQLVNDNYIGA